MLMAYDYFRFTEFIMIATLASIFTLIRKEGITIKISDLYLFSPPKRDIPIVPFAILLYMKFWGTVNVWPTDTQILWALARILKGFLRMY